MHAQPEQASRRDLYPFPLLRQPEHSTQRSPRLLEAQCVQLGLPLPISSLSVIQRHSKARQYTRLLKCSNCIYVAVLIYLMDCMGLCDKVMMSKACERVTFILLCVT